MTQSEKKIILAAKEKYLKRRHPGISNKTISNFLYYAKTDTTSNGLTACVIDFLKFEGHQAERISVQGQARIERQIDPYSGVKQNKGKITYTKSASTPGSADISSTIMVLISGYPIGLSVKWEVKMKDKQSPEQIKYENAIKSAGGYYFIIHNFGEFYTYYTELINRYQAATIPAPTPTP